MVTLILLVISNYLIYLSFILWMPPKGRIIPFGLIYDTPFLWCVVYRF